MPEQYFNPFTQSPNPEGFIKLPQLTNKVLDRVGADVLGQLGEELEMIDGEQEVLPVVRAADLHSFLTPAERVLELERGRFCLDIPSGLENVNSRIALANNGSRYRLDWIPDGDGYLEEDAPLNRFLVPRDVLESDYYADITDKALVDRILLSLQKRVQQERRIASVMSVGELIRTVFGRELDVNESYRNIFTAVDALGFRPAALEECLIFSRDAWRPEAGSRSVPRVYADNGGLKKVVSLCSVVSSYMFETTGVTTLEYDTEKSKRILTSQSILTMSGMSHPYWEEEDGLLMMLKEV